MAQENKRHQAGRRPEITRNIYNAVRKYDRQSFERWVDHIYGCGYEDGIGSDQAIAAAAGQWDAGHTTGLLDAIEIIAKVKGIGPKKLEEIKDAINEAVEVKET